MMELSYHGMLIGSLPSPCNRQDGHGQVNSVAPVCPCLYRVPIEEAQERVSGELLCPYPPGIPVVHPGEVISGDALQLLRQVVASGGKVLGASDPTLASILVMKRPEDFGKEEYWGASNGAAGDHGWLEDK